MIEEQTSGLVFAVELGKIIEGLGSTLLGTVIGGPAGLATGAINLVGNLFGVDAKDQAAITQAITTSPEAAIKLKQLENERIDYLLNVQLEMAKLDAGREQVMLGDKANARQREISTADWTPRLLASVVVVGWIGVQAFLLTHVIDQTMRELVARVLGTLDGALMLVLSYYFGSSSGSRSKDETMADLAVSGQAQAQGAKKP